MKEQLINLELEKMKATDISHKNDQY